VHAEARATEATRRPKGFCRRRNTSKLEIFFQRPLQAATTTPYGKVQQRHGLGVGALLPDLLLRFTTGSEHRWVVGEIKGVGTLGAKYANDALFDLLAYRQAYDHTLSGQPGAWGLGIAWGEGLDPSSASEVVLCTPDNWGRLSMCSRPSTPQPCTFAFATWPPGGARLVCDGGSRPPSGVRTTASST
jgi:hypothetical protein